MMPAPATPSVWFPTIRAGSGADIFTERLASSLRKHGVRAEITWLPHRAEYAPWSVTVPRKPAWANIVHVNTWLHRRFLPEAVPIVATMHHCIHDPALIPHKNLAQKAYHRAWIKPLEAAVLQRAAKITAVSRYTAHRTRVIFGTSDIAIIPNGLDPHGPFHCLHDANIPHSPFRLLFVGNWSARKGCDLLAPIMQTLGSGFELWVLTGLRARRHINLPDNIRLLDQRPDEDTLAQLYCECDALLFPSRLEGFGMVALEAQACGLPVIATNGSALPEVVEHGVTGLLCKMDTIEDFVDAAKKLSADTVFYRSLSIAARTQATTRFDLNGIVNNYIDLYLEILSHTNC